MPLAMHNVVATPTKDNKNPVPVRRNYLADAAEFSFAIDTNPRHFQALVQQNAELLRTRTLLTERLSSLELALAKSNQLANYDELTGLPNRRLLLDRFNQAASLANRHDQSMALLFFDLNKFKSVNDKFGHEAGDTLLQQFAIRLTNAIRQADTACRYGGDEFVVLLSEIGRRENAVKILQKIRAELALPYVFGCHSIRLAVSNGMAIYPQDAGSFTDLVRISDHSMFRNKPGKKGDPDGVTILNTWLHSAGPELT